MARVYYECECSANILSVEYDEEFKHYYLAVWEYQNAKYSFIHRLKAMLKMLTSGNVHNDQIILSQASVDKLIKDLKKNKEKKNG